MDRFPDYQYRGARAMILLHEQYLHEFFETWKQAGTVGVVLPESTHSAYASFEALLKHVLGCAGNYMKWICEKLELSDPGIKPPPELNVIEVEAESYLEHIIQKWRTPLADIPEEPAFWKPLYKSEWEEEYSINSMLEHAVLHPAVHRFQLIELINNIIT